MRFRSALAPTLFLLVSMLLSSQAIQALPEESPRAKAVQPFLSEAAIEGLASLTAQDYRGRMKPVDTLAREMVMKVTKKGTFEGWHPVELFFSWYADPQYWWNRDLISVRYPGLKNLLGVGEDVGRVSPASMFDAAGNYRLATAVEEAMRTPDRQRSKTQRKLLSFDERFNLLYIAMQGRSLRIFPLPDDVGKTWGDVEDIMEMPREDDGNRFHAALQQFSSGMHQRDNEGVLRGVAMIAELQTEFGAEVLPSPRSMRLELALNRTAPFMRVTLVYLAAFMVLMASYIWCLARRGGRPYAFRHPAWATGQILFILAFLIHLGAYICRWIASERAPLSNGYESLLFIGLMVAMAGLLFEWRDRQGVASGLASLLAALVLGVSMLSSFDPAIGPLVPVLNSYWLNIHVTVITAGYGFLGLAAMLGALILVLHLFKNTGRESVRAAVRQLDGTNFNVLLAGLALLAIGTLLGGIWANEAWGRYWGWDAKETWSLATILIYSIVLHFRWIPGLNRPWARAAGSFAAIAAVLMTYFGVNYFLSGLHSYASGSASVVPLWAWILGIVMLLLIWVSNYFERSRSWE